MNDEAGGRRRLQFSLGKLIFWFLLVSCMVGVVVAAYNARDEYGWYSRTASTRARLHNISIALMLYRQEWDVYPGWESVGTQPVSENSFNQPSAVKGNRQGEPFEDVKVLKFLEAQRYLDRGLQESYPDRWGRPMVVRFLRVPEAQPDGSMKVVERFYVWSYGEDGINGVDATPHYTNRGAPDYDREEVERIEKSLKDCGDDIVVSDR